MKTPYNALDVAHYIVKYSNEHSYEISNIKLQELLYFVQEIYDKVFLNKILKILYI